MQCHEKLLHSSNLSSGPVSQHKFVVMDLYRSNETKSTICKTMKDLAVLYDFDQSDKL